MSSIFSIFNPAPHAEEIQDSESVKRQYNYWRIRVFYSMFLGYAFYYFTRKSFTFAMPTLVTDLGLDKSELGILGSIMAIAYGLSKFINGIIGDRSNPRYFMAVGLILTGVTNIFFGLSSSLLFFAVFWGLNGWFQGFGWPGCARLLTHWYSHSERGRWWSFWNTSHNIGGAIIPIIIGVCAGLYGWRSAMIATGSFCILAGFFLINRLRDTPQSLGLPAIEKFRNDVQSHVEQEKELSVREILMEHVLKNPFIWVLAFSYFFVYIIRQAVNDWSVLYLVEEKNYSQIASGGVVMWFEVGGFFGSLAAGWASDKLFQGRRGPINVLFSFLICLAVAVFAWAPFDSCFFDSLMMFLIGFLIFGPQMLIGMAAAELSHKKAAATASGFTGTWAYAGAAVAGYPLGFVIQNYGWDGYFVVLSACGAISSLLLLPLWAIKRREDGLFKKTPEPIPVPVKTENV
ncbi:MAG: MFS transporter family glucose-6-phosphate receptor UhpC [Verrucomicrobia bacterium]|nr:MFS transporter family glucose-6-phosphate receptor UhpC [Verrucomicrobiota bacterium]